MTFKTTLSDPYDDPNRIVERIEHLISMARNAYEEANTILDGARFDGERRAIIVAAQERIARFSDEVGGR